MLYFKGSSYRIVSFPHSCVAFSEFEVLIARDSHDLRYADSVRIPQILKVVHGESSWLLLIDFIRVFI